MTDSEIQKKEMDLDMREKNLLSWAEIQKQEHMTQTQAIKKVLKGLTDEGHVICLNAERISAIETNGQNQMTILKEIKEAREKESEKVRDELTAHYAEVKKDLKEYNEELKRNIAELFKGRNDNALEISKIKTTGKVALWIIGFFYSSMLGVCGWMILNYEGIITILRKISTP